MSHSNHLSQIKAFRGADKTIILKMFDGFAMPFGGISFELWINHAKVFSGIGTFDSVSNELTVVIPAIAINDIFVSGKLLIRLSKRHELWAPFKLSSNAADSDVVKCNIINDGVDVTCISALKFTAKRYRSSQPLMHTHHD
ncbi:hypothetical protein MUK70_12855 [Dyadobacter chenwenxiniae]|uniref:Uncharacterized protein n=1 Tax=Dyadobacter chenwenxiniae TaxID=2906456 RepID=A0A9X1PHR4_9BACT|nr:hypothetical protein [Dyadobacter chenwenxiniae]MCF0060134.1 hypothetical protein [Dyadobacter chenwenxiniae]UON85871.1 hypothetical protein MUK70_12855 [Dyadobacter chenwenxiniae]